MSNVLNARMAPPFTEGHDRDYRLIIFDTPLPNEADIKASAKASIVGVGGDHLYIARLDGSGALQIRFGAGKPWINVREGQTLKRSFSEVHIRDAGLYSTKVKALCHAEIYTSYGEMFKETGDSHCIPAGFAAITANLTADTTVSLSSILAGANEQLFPRGSILIKCLTASACSVGIAHGPITNAWNASAPNNFQLDAGETVAFDYSGKLGPVMGYIGGVTPKYQVLFDILLWGLTPATLSSVSIIATTRPDMSDSVYCNAAKIALPLGLQS